MPQTDYLAALTKKRKAESQVLLNSYVAKGLKNSVVEKYSGQAHFIYELLQNADDAGATVARFVLEPDKLLFFHNGTRRFTISNPASENEDDSGGKIGDINAITSIGGSNKNDHSTIGKFGIGFKAVFQYTATPYIYDDNFHFRIEDLFVPVPLNNDHSDRKTGWTLFIFPFNHVEKTAEISYSEIKNKLFNLDYPVLFLSHLQEVQWVDKGITYIYKKTLLDNWLHKDIQIELLELIHVSSEDAKPLKQEKLWLFTRKTTQGLSYCVGIFLDSDNKLIKNSKPAFCYFPTREETGLNFLIHAPFLLTDSRDNIQAGKAHNKEMVKLLACLAADSIESLKFLGKKTGVKLITDDILDLIPYDPAIFEAEDSPRKISFLPFYDEILKKFKSARIIPTKGSYTDSTNGIWADEPEMASLFSNRQLGEILDDSEAAWAFPSLGRQNTIRYKQTSLRKFIDAISRVWLDESDLLKGFEWDDGTKQSGITKDFIEKQNIEWLDNFYQWILTSKKRKELIKCLPIFLDKNKKAVAIFNDNNVKTLFLPAEVENEYPTVLPDLLKLESAKELLKIYDVSQPALKDQVFTVIIPKYFQDRENINTADSFKIIFKYFRECHQKDLPDLVAALKQTPFLRFKKIGQDTPYRGRPEKIYYPEQDLKIWFKDSSDIRFLDLDFYLKLIKAEEKESFQAFLEEIGVNFTPRILEKCYKGSYPWPYADSWRRSTRTPEWRESEVEGVVNALENIDLRQDSSLSFLLWKYLLHWCERWQLDSLLYGRYEYFYYSWCDYEYSTHLSSILGQIDWLVDRTGNFAKPAEITREELDPRYLEHPESYRLCELLEIPSANESEGNNTYISSLEEFGASLNLTPEEQRQALEAFAASKQNRNDNVSSADDDKQSEVIKESSPENVLLAAAKKLKKLEKKRTKQESKTSAVESGAEEDAGLDTDEYSPPQANLKQKIESIKKKAEKELEAYAHLEKLNNDISSFPKYTWGWLKTLLELESLENNSVSSGSREISINFGKVEREPDTQRTLILKQPSRYIPQMMEELTEIPLELEFSDGSTSKLPIEVINVKSYTLRVKLKAGTEIQNIDFKNVINAHIEAQSPAFLFSALMSALTNLADKNNWQDDFNLCEDLPKNIEFIFGPPGTGKSTAIASLVLDLLHKPGFKNILILAPTNKAADVLVNRILVALPENAPVPDWLIRFGVTSDEEIEKKGILKAKNFALNSLRTRVIITTIARYPYDYFFINDSNRRPLSSMEWNYVIIDEASMIHLPYLLYPLFNSDPKKFIIAGDPHQIQPIAAVDRWKDENIYTLVRLNSFSNPVTVPIQYKVRPLTTQHRALPKIGQLFNNLAYDGVLNHSRDEGETPALPVNCALPLSTVNIIKFPVRKYESIYRSQRLNHGSPYHIYSALFAFEFVKYLAGLAWPEKESRPFRIGIIAPYRAQADIVAKLVDGMEIAHGIELQVGTIHGFQGDECEAIVALFNPPPGISDNENMFLNKLNIINVAISRARDYLFILMPDNDTERVDNLAVIKELERLCKDQGCNILDSQHIEEQILGSPTFLEDNSFATSHHDVNVYRKPEKKYEIRCESTAVDLQVHFDKISET